MITFIYNRMVEDRRDGAGGVGQWSDCPAFFAWCYPFNSLLLATWGARVQQDGPWDYKKDLARWGKYTPVRLNPAPEMLYYDVWTNIHYGYVGRAHKIPADILHAGAEELGGARSVSDWVSNEIGIQLWNNYGTSLQKAHLESAVRRMSAYRNDAGDNYLQVHRGLAP